MRSILYHRLLDRGRRIAVIAAAAVSLVGCSDDDGVKPKNDGPIPDETATFHFDVRPAKELNPTITEGGITISFTTDEAVNPAGDVQFVDDERAEPYRGKGNLRLSTHVFGAADDVGVNLYVSTALYAMTLFAFQGDELGGDPVTTPFVFEAYAGDGTALGSFSTTRFTPSEAPTYEQLTFTSAVGIRRLRLLGMTNVSYFDEMTVSTVPPGAVDFTSNP
jgi:hypothetical protein